MIGHRLVTLTVLLALMIAALPFVSAQDGPPPLFATYEDFQAALESAVSSGDIDPFWDQIVAEGRMPLIFGETVVFLYRGEADRVEWRGDFNAWQSTAATEGRRQGDTDLWMVVLKLPLDARLDYKIVVNGGEWRLDDLNPYQQVGGFGPNSEIRMPAWEYPTATITREDIAHGSLSDDILIHSVNLDYDVNYRVYTPAGYEENELSDLPVFYVTDGQDYYHPQMGSMVIVADNLIADGAIQPLIIVFIDARDPHNAGSNRRGDELVTNADFADFLAQELVPAVDTAYRTHPSADARGILGTSLGGLNSAFVGLQHPDVFHWIAMQSPAFGSGPTVIGSYRRAERLPLKIFISQGTVWDDVDNTRYLHHILEEKGYPVLLIEVSDGHSWGNWRALLDDMLIYFVGAEAE